MIGGNWRYENDLTIYGTGYEIAFPSQRHRGKGRAAGRWGG